VYRLASRVREPLARKTYTRDAYAPLRAKEHTRLACKFDELGSVRAGRFKLVDMPSRTTTSTSTISINALTCTSFRTEVGGADSATKRAPLNGPGTPNG
jgi:hypothetical protein